MASVAPEVTGAYSVCQMGGLLDFIPYPFHCVLPPLYARYIWSLVSQESDESFYNELTASSANYGTIEIQHFCFQDKMSKCRPWRCPKHTTPKILSLRYQTRWGERHKIVTSGYDSTLVEAGFKLSKSPHHCNKRIFGRIKVHQGSNLNV
jgi:hypothetical protein